MVGGPPAVPDWAEKDSTAGGYIKNKPNVLEISGGTMTGPLNVQAPTENANAANKEYVDNYVNSKHFTATATIAASGWNGAAAPYTQTVTVAGVLAADCPHISPVYSDTLAVAKKQKEAWEAVSKAVTADGSILFICFENMPATDIPIQVEVNR